MAKNSKNMQKTFPPQHQNRQPGVESEMTPLPQFDNPNYKASGKLEGKTALITGGDSGIGRAVALLFAKEGANVCIVYLDEHDDANTTKKLVEAQGKLCLCLSGDIGEESFCKQVISEAIQHFGGLDILVNNAAEQHPQKDITSITSEQLKRTFQTNVFSYFYMIQAALPHLKSGSTIINTASITAYEGNEQLIDYSATKGAIVTLTRSLSKSLVKKGIRVNGVAPGPIWTPLIPSTFPPEQVETFGASAPMKRAGQPKELAPAYVYLASDDSSYVTGQILHINGGTIVNG